MALTDADKAEAKALGLSPDEARIARATRIPFERYAFHKAAIQRGRDADAAMLDQFGAALTDHLKHAVHGRGQPLPPVEDTDQT